MTPDRLALLAACLSALIYGVFFITRPPSLARTAFKTLPLLMLALFAFLMSAPWLLVAGLALSAVGDAAISRDGEPAFVAGLAVFLLAHVAYVVWFAASVQVWRPDLRQSAELIALALVAFALVRVLWPRLGDMRLPVACYMVAILAMGGLSVLLPASLLPVSIGALLFVASDCVLAAETFLDRQSRLTSHFVWWSYFAGQLLIAVGGSTNRVFG